ncbi:MAG TPA: phytanoyl-CoA dioxygenase family protein [Chthonomonadaceae bacterium]|nr:phytanoyl-CoA dioxygenase family protein [Chthonomonadaceae bacterium]
MLTPEQVNLYRRNGFLTGLPVADAEEAPCYRALFDALEQRVGRERARIGLLDCHFDEPFIWELATHPRILGAVESLLGPEVLLLATHFFCKYGQEEKFVAWHQDVTYWGLEPPVAVTAWYAVDDSDRENGCMRVIPGTHLGGIRAHGKAEQAGNLLSINQEVPVHPEEERAAVDLPLKAGQMSLHDGALIHGSLPNRSPRRRCGLTLRYIPSFVRQVTANSMGARWKAVPVPAPPG